MKAKLTHALLVAVWPKLPVCIIGFVYKAHRAKVEKSIAIRIASIEF